MRTSTGNKQITTAFGSSCAAQRIDIAKCAGQGGNAKNWWSEEVNCHTQSHWSVPWGGQTRASAASRSALARWYPIPYGNDIWRGQLQVTTKGSLLVVHAQPREGAHQQLSRPSCISAHIERCSNANILDSSFERLQNRDRPILNG